MRGNQVFFPLYYKEPTVGSNKLWTRILKVYDLLQGRTLKFKFLLFYVCNDIPLTEYEKKLGELIDFNVQLSSDNPTLHAFFTKCLWNVC